MKPITKSHSNAVPLSIGPTRRWLVAGTTALALGAATLFSVGAPPVRAQATVAVVDVVAVAEGYRASKLFGVKVKNTTGEEIGAIDDLVVDQKQVLYAILQIGGFLGIGGYLIAVPYQNLEIKDAGKTITLKAGGSKEELQKTPEFKYGKNQQ
jgi:sporulation protein YlmC with PRC-barrel domain